MVEARHEGLTGSAKPTPGPWKKVVEIDRIRIIKPGATLPSKEVCRLHGPYHTDADLILAAPDLLAAVKVLMVAVAGEPGPLGADAREAIRVGGEAVAKATNKASAAPDARAINIAYADDLLDALTETRAAVVRYEDDDALNAAKQKADAALVLVGGPFDDGEDGSDPSDKSLATYDHDADPANDPKFWCVSQDGGEWRAKGYTTRDEAQAYEGALDYCQTIDLIIKSVYEAADEGAAIDKAKADGCSE